MTERTDVVYSFSISFFVSPVMSAISAMEKPLAFIFRAASACLIIEICYTWCVTGGEPGSTGLVNSKLRVDVGQQAS